MILSLIAAIGKNRELGFGNRLPWHIPSDLQRFKRITHGHTVIMGRRTFESIGHPLPERRNLVLSGEQRWNAPGSETISSFEETLARTSNENEVFVIGGAQIYALALPFAQKMYLTHVEATPEADVFFPEFNPAEWKIISSEHTSKSVTEPFDYTFTIYEKAA